MKTVPDFKKSTTCILLILPVISVLSLQAQDVLVSFAGVGESSKVDSVIVENVTQGKILRMKGSDTLRLVSLTTVIEPINKYKTGKVFLYPNPVTDLARIRFTLQEAGETVLRLYDITGRIIAQTRNLLSVGQHTYTVQGIKEGLYVIKINSGRFSYSSKLISSASGNSAISILYEDTENLLVSQDKPEDSKGTCLQCKTFSYNLGDRFKITGTSTVSTRAASTVITTTFDPENSSLTLTFNFSTCYDGNEVSYSVVQIGTQLWMAENLKTSKYINGENILYVTENSKWEEQGTYGYSAYCWYNNDIGNKIIYGALYNDYTDNICPTEWHKPTEDEWTILANYLGFIGNAGGKLKEPGTLHWLSPNTGATNQSGFSAVPGGYRSSNGTFFHLGEYGVWQCFSNYTENPPTVHLTNNSGSMSIVPYYRSVGKSVRCLKDSGIGVLKDIDGNLYTTINVGNQVWMGQNLATTHYNDGSDIPLVTDNSLWNNLATPGYCFYDNDAFNIMKNTYGALYNWYSVNTGRLCPSGWHVPSEVEWSTLLTNLGGESIAAGGLKEAGTEHWHYPNTRATNETGFTALPGGSRNNNYNFQSIGHYGTWWSVSESDSQNAYFHTMSYSSNNVTPGIFLKTSGYSVRCLKD